MVRAWYMDNEKSDQRLEHHRNPPKFVSLEELFTICGVEYFPVCILYSSTVLSIFFLLSMSINVDSVLDKCEYICNRWCVG